MTTLIYNVRFPGQPMADGWIAIKGERIEAVGTELMGRPKADEVFDGEGALLMPGVIDCHVHFREPGLEHKADIAAESRAAVASGVTSYLDMPNCKPPTTTVALWADKMERAKGRSLTNYGFFIGATNSNIDQLKEADYTRVPGVKLFMGSSTGNMLVDDARAIHLIFSEVDAIVAVHAEEQSIIAANTQVAKQQYPQGQIPLAEHSRIRSVEACFASTARAVELAKQSRHRLHICHLTTERELGLLERGPIQDKLITSEVSPHHLLWCDEDYGAKGARIKMNPAVKSRADRDALLRALKDGLIDMVATDHAPHEWAAKEGDALTAASGAPMVQFSLPAMLGLLDEATVARVMCSNPALVYGIEDRGTLLPGCYADLVLVRETTPYKVTDAEVLSRCGWTPMAGYTLRHRVEKTWVNGQLVYDDGKFSDTIHSQPLRFNARR